jgi:hypothetical protein
MKRKIVVRCDLSLIIGNLNSERSFVIDAESPISPYAIAGSAVFLVEDIHTLSCIGIVIGTVAEKTYFFTSIQDNLEKLSHSLGQSVVIQPFDNTTVRRLFSVPFILQIQPLGKHMMISYPNRVMYIRMIFS